MTGTVTFTGTITFGNQANLRVAQGVTVGASTQFIFGSPGSPANNITIYNEGTLNILEFRPGTFVPIRFIDNIVLNNYSTGIANIGITGSAVFVDGNNTVLNNCGGSISISGNLQTTAGTTINNLNGGRFTVDGNFVNNSNLNTTGSGFNVTGNLTVNNGTTNITGTVLEVGGSFVQSGGTVVGGSDAMGCGIIRITPQSNLSQISGGTFGNGTFVRLCDGGPFSGFDSVAGGTINPIDAAALFCDCTIQLPVDLLYFRAAYANGQVKLTWATASETTNDYFTIEKSRDGKNFTEVTRVKGAANSSNLLTYVATDANPYAGLSYYRLKQTDLDGKFVYFPIKAVNSDKQAVVASLFPNPVSLNGQLQLGLGGQDGDVSVTVYDQIGRQCFQTKYASGAVPDIAVSNFTRSSGLYVVQISQGNTITRQRIVVR